MSEVKKKRQSNFTSSERQTLLKLANQFKNVIENKKTDGTTWKEKEDVWKKIETLFNSTGGGEPRTGKQLKFKYDSIKKELKKKYAEHRSYVRGTGGGMHQPGPMPQSEEEKNLIETIAVSVAGLNANFDSDALAGIEGIPCEAVDVEEKKGEVQVDWSFPSASYLQTEKTPTLQVVEVAETLEVTPLAESFEVSLLSETHEVTPPKETETPTTSGHWSARRRPQIIKKKSMSSAAGKFETLADKKTKLVEQMSLNALNENKHAKLEHEKRMELLKAEHDKRMEILKEEAELIKLKKEVQEKKLKKINE